MDNMLPDVLNKARDTEAEISRFERFTENKKSLFYELTLFYLQTRFDNLKDELRDNYGH